MLAQKLGGKSGTIKKFDVFVKPTKEAVLISQFDAYKKNGKLDHLKSIVTELLDGLDKISQWRYNNALKRGNVPFDIIVDSLQDDSYVAIHNIGSLDIDFGQCGEKSGIIEQGKADMYSMGLVILYLLTQNDELFYYLRDSSVTKQQIQQIPAFKFVMSMMNLNQQQSVIDCKNEWESIKTKVKLITWASVQARLRVLDRFDEPKPKLKKKRKSLIKLQITELDTINDEVLIINGYRFKKQLTNHLNETIIWVRYCFSI